MSIDRSSFSSALSCNNAGNSAWMNVESFCNTNTRLSRSMLTDNAGNIFIREFPDASHVDSCFYGMTVVSDSINPFEVGDQVIRFDCIDVVDLREFVGIGDESQGHQSMHRDITKCRGVAEIDTGVSTIVRPTSEFSAFEISGPSDSYARPNHGLIRSAQTSYLASIAYLVEVGEFSNCNWTPFFDHKTNPSSEMLASSSMASKSISR